MATAANDWSGGAGYFSVPPGTPNEIDQSLAADPQLSAWDGFWDGLAVQFQSPGLQTVGPATAAAADDASGAASSVGNAISSAASATGNFFSGVGNVLSGVGTWAVIVLALLVVGIIAWKV